MRKLATGLKQWPSRRAEILDKLGRSGQHRYLVEIYLEEKEIDLALEALARSRNTRRDWWDSSESLELKVAEATEASRPQEAIRLYLGYVERLIEQRGRDNYGEAAGHLKKVRDVYKRLGEPQAWQGLIADLRQRNRRLPALQDELNQAGL